MRSICVYIQISRSLLRLCSDTRAPFGSRDELRDARFVGPVEDLLDRKVAQLLGEDLDAPRAGVSGRAARRDVAADREVAFAGKAAMVDGLVDEVGHALGASVAQLDPAEVA